MMMATAEESNHPLVCHEGGEQDVCRVCRCEGTPDRPLFFPCLCSGSIKFVHQDCLVEWLKVSKRRYCELCKHEYTFEALYKAETPTRMPVLVYAMGVIAHIARFLQSIARSLLVTIVWVISVPWITTLLTTFTFGRSAFSVMLAAHQLDLFTEESSILSVLKCTIDVTQGILTTCVFALAVLLSVILKEYLAGAGFWQRLEGSLNPLPPPTSDVIEPVADAQHAAHAIEETRSEAGSMASVDGVTAREYRAYMRRQRLYRDRLEREQARLRGTSSPTADNNEEDGGTETNPTFEDQSVTSHQRSTNTVRDFCCRICSSRMCVSMEHVRLASHRQRVAMQAARMEQARLEQEAARHASPVEQPAPHPPAQHAEGVVIVLTTDEAFGMTGPVLHLFRNALIVLVCNIAFLNVSIGLPYLLGWTLLQGFGWSVMELFAGLLHDFVGRLVLLMTGKTIPLDLALPNHLLHHYHRSLYKTKMLLRRLDTTPPYPDVIKGTLLSLLLGYIAIVLTVWTLTSIILGREQRHRLANPPRPFSQLASCLICLAAFFKTACMAAVEMFVFPVLTGHLLDICLLPLVDGSPWSRLSHAISHPLTSLVIHWALGIGVMFYVSAQIGAMRKLMRPGILHFLRDPNDPDFHPLNELLERPLSQQCIRIAKSATLYTVCCCGLFGVFAKGARWLLPTLPNIRLHFNDPVTEIPLDLLLHTLLRAVANAIQWRATPHPLSLTITHASRLLRLSSFLRGHGRYCREESFTGLWQWVPGSNRAYQRERLIEMAGRPVEPLDIAKLPIIEGHAHQQDVASMAAAIAHSEQEATRLSQRHRRPHPPQTHSTPPTTDFVVVYKPDKFAARMCAFTTIMWMNFLGSLFVTCLAPICLGRYLMSLWLNRPVHEMYTWTLGAFLLICSSKLVISAHAVFSQCDASRARRILREWPTATLKALLLASTTALLWPALIGIYANALAWPLLASPQQIPIVFPIPTIVFGIPVLRLLYLARQHFLSPIALILVDSLDTPSAFFSYPFMPMMRHVLLPYTALLLALLALPPLAVLLVCPLLNMPTPQILLLQQWSSLASLLVPLLYSLSRAIAYTHGQMRRRIWEDTYTLGQRLRNLNERPSSRSV